MAEPVVFPELIIQRFWSRVEPDENGCMIWGGARTSTGYGRYSVKDANGLYTNYRAHRFAWLITNGHIPANRELCHSCDVRLCVNPEHTFIGTHRDNMMDAKAKGRLVVPDPPQRGKGRNRFPSRYARQGAAPIIETDEEPEMVITPKVYAPSELEDFDNDAPGPEDYSRGDGWRWEELFD